MLFFMNPFEDFITHTADEMSERDWSDLCRSEDIFHLSDYFFERFNAQIKWDSLRRNPYITTDFAHKYKDYFGCILYYKNGTYHREDGPAIIDSNNSLEVWYKEGVKHREDGPAFIFEEERESWWFEGKLHRVDGPAVIKKDRKEWWVNNQRHREDGPAIISNNTEEWWLNGQRHRDDGQPARIVVGVAKGWYEHGEMHNTQGPAYVEESGHKEYWINGEEFEYETFYRKIKEGDYEE